MFRNKLMFAVIVSMMGQLFNFSNAKALWELRKFEAVLSSTEPCVHQGQDFLVCHQLMFDAENIWYLRQNQAQVYELSPGTPKDLQLALSRYLQPFFNSKPEASLNEEDMITLLKNLFRAETAEQFKAAFPESWGIWYSDTVVSIAFRDGRKQLSIARDILFPSGVAPTETFATPNESNMGSQGKHDASIAETSDAGENLERQFQNEKRGDFLMAFVVIGVGIFLACFTVYLHRLTQRRNKKDHENWGKDYLKPMFGELLDEYLTRIDQKFQDVFQYHENKFSNYLKACQEILELMSKGRQTQPALQTWVFHTAALHQARVFELERANPDDGNGPFNDLYRNIKDVYRHFQIGADGLPFEEPYELNSAKSKIKTVIERTLANLPSQDPAISDNGSQSVAQNAKNNNDIEMGIKDFYLSFRQFLEKSREQTEHHEKLLKKQINHNLNQLINQGFDSMSSKLDLQFKSLTTAVETRSHTSNHLSGQPAVTSSPKISPTLEPTLHDLENADASSPTHFDKTRLASEWNGARARLSEKDTFGLPAALHQCLRDALDSVNIEILEQLLSGETVLDHLLRTKHSQAFVKTWNQATGDGRLGHIATVRFHVNNHLAPMAQQLSQHPIFKMKWVLDQIWAHIESHGARLGVSFHQIGNATDVMQANGYVTKADRIANPLKMLLEKHSGSESPLLSWFIHWAQAHHGIPTDKVVWLVTQGYDVINLPQLGRHSEVNTINDIAPILQCTKFE